METVHQPQKPQGHQLPLTHFAATRALNFVGPKPMTPSIEERQSRSMCTIVHDMMDEVEQKPGTPADDEPQQLDILGAEQGTFGRVILAAFSAVPWIAMMAALSAEAAQGKVNKVFQATLNEHKGKLDELQAGLTEMGRRIDSFGPDAQARIQDESYLEVVRKGFRVWDRCSTKDKRDRVFALLTNAASTSVVEDDIVRLFLDWIDRYHDAHFGIIREVSKSRGLTRLDIWRQMGGADQLPKENSSEADLFRMLIDDLSRGRVIRQEREYNAHHDRFVKPPPKKRAPKGQADPFYESTWEGTKPYELSELGKDFVHYVLQEAVTRLDGD
tara:strand:- start:208 stop:1194 length:987 start_codon:yes stop_codon:yes gene_type:complete